MPFVGHKWLPWMPIRSGLRDKTQIEETKSLNTVALTSVNNTQNNEKRQIDPVKQITNSEPQEETISCASQSKITGPIQWKEVYGEYLGKEPDFPEILIQGSPKVSRKSSETPSKIARKFPDSPLIRHHKDIEDVQINKETIVRKDQRRVHFEDEVGVKCDDESGVMLEHRRKNCLTDCSMCRSIPQRDFSPPYQALVEKSRHNDPTQDDLKK